MTGSLDKKLRRVASECVVVRMRMANRAVSAIYDEALRAHGLKASQMNLLVAIGCHGEVSPGDLCEHLQIEKSTLSRNLERMRQSGWLLHSPGDDARSVVWRLSAAGKRLFEAVLPDWSKAQEEAKLLLGPTLVAELDQLAGRLRRS